MALFSKIEGQLASGVRIRHSGTKSFIADVSIIPASALAFDHTISASNRTSAQDKGSLAIFQSRPPFSIMQNPKDVWVLRGRPGERGIRRRLGPLFAAGNSQILLCLPHASIAAAARQSNKRGRKPLGRRPTSKEGHLFNSRPATCGGGGGGHHTSAPRKSKFSFFYVATAWGNKENGGEIEGRGGIGGENHQTRFFSIPQSLWKRKVWKWRAD